MKQNPDSPMLKMPELDDAGYVIEYLLEIGTSMASGFGITPLTWSEIYSWSELSQTELSRWEASTIMSLSRTFTSKYNMFDEKDFPTPYILEEFDREEVSKTIGGALRLMASRMNKK